MEYLKKKIDTFLSGWKVDLERNPLIVKGARQIGKTEWFPIQALFLKKAVFSCLSAIRFLLYVSVPVRSVRKHWIREISS